MVFSHTTAIIGALSFDFTAVGTHLKLQGKRATPEAIREEFCGSPPFARRLMPISRARLFRAFVHKRGVNNFGFLVIAPQMRIRLTMDDAARRTCFLPLNFHSNSDFHCYAIFFSRTDDFVTYEPQRRINRDVIPATIRLLWKYLEVPSNARQLTHGKQSQDGLCVLHCIQWIIQCSRACDECDSLGFLQYDWTCEEAVCQL